MMVKDERTTRPGPVPSCGTPVRGRLGFVVTELGSLWRELRKHRLRADRATGEVR